MVARYINTGISSLLLAVILIFMSARLHASQFFFDVERYSIKSGLPDSTVFSIAKDQQGFLWLGTPNGLSRFNGISFDNFSVQLSHETDVATRNNSNIFIDSQQRLWVGTWGQGVYVYDRFLKLKYHLSTTNEESLRLNSDLVQTFFEDDDQNIWIGTNGGGVAVFQSNSQQITSFIHQPDDINSLSHDRVWDITQDTDGGIWVATGNGLDHVRFKHNREVTRLNSSLSKQSLLYQQRIRRLLITPQGQFWVGTENGLCVIEATPQHCQVINEFNAQNYTDVRVNSLVQGDDNQLWVGTLSGVYLLNTEQQAFVPLVSEDKHALLPHDDIRDIYYDEAGVLWIASRPSGLIKVSFIGDSIAGFNQFFDEQGNVQPIGRVHALLIDRDKQLWIGSTQGLLTMKSSEELPTRFDDSLGLVVSMLEDQNGTLWVGSNNGLFRKSIDQSVFENQNSKFPDDQNYLVESMFEDSKGNIWLGTSHNGLFRLQGKDIVPETFEQLPQLAQSAIAAIGEDRHQFVVVAVLGFGVFRFRPDSEKFDVYQPGQLGDLYDNNVIDLLVDNDKSLWVATNSKLNQLDDIANLFRYFPQQERLKNLAIKKLVNDNNNNIWFSSANGIYQLNMKTKALDHFTTRNGLHGDQFVTQSGLATENGELYFGGTDGFSRIRTEFLDDKNVTSKMTISHITVDDRDILFPENIETNKNRYPHTVKDIEFSFTDLNLLSNYAAEYRYRLLGHKDNWSLPAEQSKVSYSGLSPGKYEFQVESVGKVASSTVNFRFEILRPWWLTWTAIAIYALIISLLIGSRIRWRLNSLHQQNKLLEREVAKRSSELVQAETQLIESKKNASLTSLVVGVAHEINTPIGIAVTASSIIQDDANRLIERFKHNKVTRSELDKALHNIIQSSGLISTNLEKSTQLIQSFKNLSTDQISLTARRINLFDYLQEVLINLGPTLDRAGVKWSLECANDIELKTNPGAIAQLITQLALNAIDHAFEQVEAPCIMIKAQKHSGYFHLRFEDNGVGVSDELKEKIFKPFFTTKRQHGNIGLGLQIVANIVTIRLNGSITIEDNQPCGTAFVCQILSEEDSNDQQEADTSNA